MNDAWLMKNVSEDEILDMMQETSQLAAQEKAQFLSSAAVAAQSSNSLANSVEFWRWMGRNWPGIFKDSSTMQQYIAKSADKKEWFIKQIQGKGYEWDWMQAQRNNFKNIFQKFYAGDVPNRPGSDVTKTNLITGKSAEYQLKAYLSEGSLDLSNTSKEMIVVTNKEKVGDAYKQGYCNVEKFKDKKFIAKNNKKRMNEVRKGKVSTTYNFRNVAGTMAKAGAVAAVIGMSTESIVLYRQYKSGEMTAKQYITNVLKAGGNAGITGSATAGVMIPVSVALNVAKVSSRLNMPVAIIIGGSLDQLVAPCFGRGKYRKILNEAKFYQNLEFLYDDLTSAMEIASNHYYGFICGLNEQAGIYQALKAQSEEINQRLTDLYDSI